MVGADICGFFINIRDAEMCTRWLQVNVYSQLKSKFLIFFSLIVRCFLYIHKYKYDINI